MSEYFDIELLHDLLSYHFSGERVQLSRTPTGEFSTSYFVDSTDRQLVLRIAPPDDAGYVFYEKGMMAQEPGIHRLISERTSAPIPEILVYDNSRSIIDRDYLIMNRLPGTPASQVHNMDGNAWAAVLHQLGESLRQIHSIRSDKYGYLGEHRCMDPQDDWVSAFRVMWDKMADDIHETGYYDNDETAYVKGVLTRHLKHFQRPVASSLMHMDIWSQNILVEGDKLTGIIDFDRACWGDSEIEFAILDYCGISEPSFWEGYGMERDVSESAQIRRIFYLLYEIQKYIVIYHLRGKDPSKPARYKRQSFEMMGEID